MNLKRIQYNTKKKCNSPKFYNQQDLPYVDGLTMAWKRQGLQEGFDFINDFNRNWLQQVREKLKDNGTIWISGTYHNIFSVGQLLQELDFKILNVITWEKNNPPPNFSCRFFTH
jgi:DNA modification methylase